MMRVQARCAARQTMRRGCSWVVLRALTRVHGSCAFDVFLAASARVRGRCMMPRAGCLTLPPSCRYVAFTQQHFLSKGQQPPPEEFIRQHYWQQKQQLEAAGGMM